MVSKSKKERKKSNPYEGLRDLKGSRLLKRLNEIDTSLQKAESASDFACCHSLLNEIRSDPLLKNEKKEVKRCLGCCCMEILRLDCELNLSDDESGDFIRMILSCLHCLESASPTVDCSRYLKILNDLQESVFLRMLVNVDIGYEFGIELLNILFSLWSSEDDQMVDSSTRIVLSLFELYRHIPGEMIDLLLMKLLDKECAARVRDVLLSRKSKFSGDIQQFCMNLLCASSGEESCYESSGSVCV